MPPSVQPRPSLRVPPCLRLGLAPLLTACHPSSPPPSSSPTPPPVARAFNQFSPGDTWDLVRIQLSLDTYEVRYRTSMPPDQMGMVYFLEDGNLHLDVKKLGDTWVLISVPLLDPSPIPAPERVVQWDRAADAQRIRSRSDR